MIKTRIENALYLEKKKIFNKEFFIKGHESEKWFQPPSVRAFPVFFLLFCFFSLSVLRFNFFIRFLDTFSDHPKQKLGSRTKMFNILGFLVAREKHRTHMVWYWYQLTKKQNNITSFWLIIVGKLVVLVGHASKCFTRLHQRTCFSVITINLRGPFLGKKGFEHQNLAEAN